MMSCLPDLSSTTALTPGGQVIYINCMFDMMNSGYLLLFLWFPSQLLNLAIVGVGRVFKSPLFQVPIGSS